MSSKNTIIHRTFVGTVVSDKMDKTVVVRIERTKTHPRYGKQFHVSLKLKVHDEKNEYHTGDRVEVVETRPLSREKRWRVVGKVRQASREATA